MAWLTPADRVRNERERIVSPPVDAEGAEDRVSRRIARPLAAATEGRIDLDDGARAGRLGRGADGARALRGGVVLGDRALERHANPLRRIHERLAQLGTAIP